jgi:hypothetical protein
MKIIAKPDVGGDLKDRLWMVTATFFVGIGAQNESVLAKNRTRNNID